MSVSQFEVGTSKISHRKISSSKSWRRVLDENRCEVSKIALSGRANESERKLGTRRVKWWARRKSRGKEAGSKKKRTRRKKREKGREKRRRGRTHTRVKPKRGPAPWTLHKPVSSALFFPLLQAGPLYLRPHNLSPRPRASLHSLSAWTARYGIKAALT